jgi:hypothetical protein
MDINYTVDPSFDFIFDEKANTMLALRKVQWGEGTPKLDLRKWYTGKEGQEVVGKGFTFLTEEGPHELTNILTKNGFGDTRTILDNIKNRDDFSKSLNIIMGKDSEFYTESEEEEEFYDPKNMLL